MADYADGTIFLTNKKNVAEIYGRKIMELYLRNNGIQTFKVKDDVAYQIDNGLAF